MDKYLVHDSKKQWWIILAVILSVFMFSVDYSMLNISLPTIATYFHVRIFTISWLPIVYLLIVTSSLLIFGKVGDLKGYKKLFILGVIIFIIGSVLCSLSPNIYFMIFFRVIQALGEAMMSPMGMAIFTTFLPENSRGRALGLIAFAQGAGLALGNLLGGFIDAQFTWRAIFWVNIPIAIFTVILSNKVLPSKQKLTYSPFDILGAVLIFLALASSVYVINSLSMHYVNFRLLIIIFAILTFTLFVFRELMVKYPLLDLRLLKNWEFTIANLVAILMLAVFMGFIFITPFYLEMVKGIDVVKTGYFMLIPTLVVIFCAPLSGILSDKFGARTFCVLGAFFGVITFIFFYFFPERLTLSLILLGISAGVFIAPNNKIIMSHAPKDKQGVASGIYKVCLSIGSIGGIAFLPFIIAKKVDAIAILQHIPFDEIRNYPLILQEGFNNAFLVLIFLCFFSFLFSIVVKER